MTEEQPHATLFMSDLQDRTRRIEFGKMLLDVGKYVVTMVVVGGLFAEQVHLGAVAVGIVLAAGISALGFVTIPPEGDA